MKIEDKKIENALNIIIFVLGNDGYLIFRIYEENSIANVFYEYWKFSCYCYRWRCGY